MLLLLHIKKRVLTALLTLLLGLLVGPVHAGGFYERNAEGWFWYEDPEIVEEEDDDEEEPELVAEPEPEEPPEPVEPLPDFTEQPEDQPEPMSVAWIRDNIDDIRNTAIDNPTDENILAYYYVQRVMLDKASTFADRARLVALEHPEIDEQHRVPGTKAGREQADQVATAMQSEIIDQLRDEAGLWFFFRNDGYSEQVARSLQMLKGRHDIHVTAISIDGHPPPGDAASIFPEYLIDDGQSETLDLQDAPAVVMVRPPDEFQVIGHGALTRSTLERRIVQGATQLGWISDREYQIALGRANPTPRPDDFTFEDIDPNDTEAIIEALGDYMTQ